VISIGSEVKVLDTYSGGLENVIGRTGRIVTIDGDNIVLDIKGQRMISYSYPGSGHSSFAHDYNVIVTAQEIEEVTYEMRDAVGQSIEIGDTVVYGPCAPGVIRGKVVAMKKEGRDTQFQLEIECDEAFHDGDTRRVSKKTTRKQWYGYGTRALVVQKSGMGMILHLVTKNERNLTSV